MLQQKQKESKKLQESFREKQLKKGIREESQRIQEIEENKNRQDKDFCKQKKKRNNKIL